MTASLDQLDGTQSNKIRLDLCYCSATAVAAAAVRTI